jgi:hypothetical protein
MAFSFRVVLSFGLVLHRLLILDLLGDLVDLVLCVVKSVPEPQLRSGVSPYDTAVPKAAVGQSCNLTRLSDGKHGVVSLLINECACQIFEKLFGKTLEVLARPYPTFGHL